MSSNVATKLESQVDSETTHGSPELQSAPVVLDTKQNEEFETRIELYKGDYHQRSLSTDSSLLSDIPSSNISKSNNKVVYGEIRPGSITHEDIKRRFVEFFNKYRRKYGSQLINKPVLSSVPSYILQRAYCINRDKIVTLLKGTLEDDDNLHLSSDACTSVCRAIDLLNNDTPHKYKELYDLFNVPRNVGETPSNWDGKKYAFYVLLNCTTINPEIIVEEVINEICKDEMINDIIGNEDIIEMIQLAASLTWDMVTLVPPAIIAFPVNYIDTWHEKRITFWDNTKRLFPLVYFRPVLFFSSLGHVGWKGEIGNVETRCIDD